jgi:hypothetical protein
VDTASSHALVPMDAEAVAYHVPVTPGLVMRTACSIERPPRST